MPRSNNNNNNNNSLRNQERKSIGHCKIRKRVSSSSSASSLVKNHRFKRAILVGKKVGFTVTTPVPTWKVKMAAFSKSPLQKLQNFENEVKYSKDLKGKEGLSARKLAATLWEINGLHSPSGSSTGSVLRHDNFDEKSPVFQIDGSKVRGHRRRSSVTSQKLQITEYLSEGLDTARKASYHHQVSNEQSPREYNSSIKTRLKDVNYTLIASKELVKVLYKILSQEEKHSSRITLVSALKVELDRAKLQVDHLIQQQQSKCDEIDTLLSQFAEEKSAWKKKEKEKVREAISSISRELEIERKLRRQAERLNKKLGSELNVERNAREKLEKNREEVEKEREMLQVADVLREERVQMKLTEAKYEFEEKSADLERLKSDLETYFLSHKPQNEEEEEESSESEVHTIELINEGSEFEPRRGSVDEVFKGRKSLSEKVQWESICLYKKSSEKQQENGKAIVKSQRLASCDEGRTVSPVMSTGRLSSSSSRLRAACSAILQDLAMRKDRQG